MPPSDYALSELARIAHLNALRELADKARSQVSTYGEDFRRQGELVEEAHSLVRDAEDVLAMAVAAERAASVSWEGIGEALQVTRQTAHERFAKATESIIEDILFPTRESSSGRPGWWACPPGLEDPDRTVRDLDEWAARHRECFDPERGERPVSEKLRRRPELVTIESVGVISRLARRVASGDLPDGISQRTALRILLEHKIRAFDRIATRDIDPENSRAARLQSAETFEQLVAWHREDLDDRLTVEPVPDEPETHRFLLRTREGSTSTLDGYRQAAIYDLSFTANLDAEATGWFVTPIDGDQRAEAPAAWWEWLGEPWPLDVAGVDVAELVTLGQRDGLQELRRTAAETAARTRPTALVQAHREIVHSLASDTAKRSVGYLQTTPAP